MESPLEERLEEKPVISRYLGLIQVGGQIEGATYRVTKK